MPPAHMSIHTKTRTQQEKGRGADTHRRKGVDTHKRWVLIHTAVRTGLKQLG